VVLPFPESWPHRALVVGPCVLIPYAAIYLAMTQWMGIASLGMLRRFTGRRS
jgi:hypothetical protein